MVNNDAFLLGHFHSCQSISTWVQTEWYWLQWISMKFVSIFDLLTFHLRGTRTSTFAVLSKMSNNKSQCLVRGMQFVLCAIKFYICQLLTVHYWFWKHKGLHLVHTHLPIHTCTHTPSAVTPLQGGTCSLLMPIVNFGQEKRIRNWPTTTWCKINATLSFLLKGALFR